MKKWNSSLEAMEPVFEKIEMLTKVQRILIFVASFLILIGAFVYFSYLPKIKAVQALEKRKTTLTSQLRTAKNKAKQLPAYREKKKKAQSDFLVAKKVLPEKKEIPSLLTSISQSGQDAGLEFLMFQPKGENSKNFYSEIPVSIKVSGGYHNVAVFFDNVARLYRIVNMRDIQMKAGGAGGLTTTCTAVTYRFIEPKKQKAGSKKKKRKKRR